MRAGVHDLLLDPTTDFPFDSLGDGDVGGLPPGLVQGDNLFAVRALWHAGIVSRRDEIGPPPVVALGKQDQSRRSSISVSNVFTRSKTASFVMKPVAPACSAVAAWRSSGVRNPWRTRKRAATSAISRFGAIQSRLG